MPRDGCSVSFWSTHEAGTEHILDYSAAYTAYNRYQARPGFSIGLQLSLNTGESSSDVGLFADGDGGMPWCWLLSGDEVDRASEPNVYDGVTRNRSGQ